jgi:hypothetical protein
MMPETIFSFVRDVVVLGYMLVLRIAVPILIVLFLGWWLQRKLVEWDAKEMAEWKREQAQEKGTSPVHESLSK